MAQTVHRTSPDGRQVDISKAVGVMTDVVLAVDDPDNFGTFKADDLVHSTDVVVPVGARMTPDGRSFQSAREESAYMLPNDTAEQLRLNRQHRIMTMLLDDQLAAAPFGDSSPRTVLDLCTGTGVWALEYAALHPEAQVLGVDLSQIQPTAGIPPNVSWAAADVQAPDGAPWLPGRAFDYVHARFVWTFVRDMRAFLRGVWDHLEPGGWYEGFDSIPAASSFDGSSAGSATEKIVGLIAAGVGGMGVDAMATARIADILREEGFVGVRERRFPAPYGEWPSDARYKTFGAHWRDETLDGMGSFKGHMLAKLDMPEAELDALVERSSAEINDPRNFHLYWTITSVCGQKPKA